MSNVPKFATAIPSARLGRHHLRLRPVRCMSVLLLGSVAAAAISPTPAVSSPCPVPARLGDGWETIGAGDARLDADALCKLLRGVAGGSDNLHSLLVAR